MNDLDVRIRAWTYRRQGLGRSAADLGTALRDVVAVYAWQPTALLSLAARTARPDAAAYRLLDDDRSAVRLPAMRLCGHLVPTSTAANVFAATTRPAETRRWLLQAAGLSGAEYEDIRAAIVDVAGEPLTVPEIRRRLSGERAERFDRRPQGGTFIVRAIRSDGALLAVVRGGLRSNAYAYVATGAWLGAPWPAIDPDTALVWLAGEYLRAFGPARVDDFRWWAGVSGTRARTAVGAHATVELDGGLLVRAEDRDAFEHVAPLDPAAVDILPLWDMVTMGYAPDGRSRLVPPEHMARAYGEGGDGLGLVLRGGLAVAAWGIRAEGARTVVDLEPFEPLAPTLRRSIEARFADLGALLEADDLRVADGPVRGRSGRSGRS